MFDNTGMEGQFSVGGPLHSGLRVSGSVIGLQLPVFHQDERL